MNYISALSRCLWLASYLSKYGQIDLAIARNHFGVYPERTYRRHIASLREAGLRMTAGRTGPGGRRGLQYFVGFDPTMADISMRSLHAVERAS